jgi:hypothetical protein
MPPTTLPLPHQLLLLALRDEKGTLAFASNVRYGLGGAILAELLLQGRVAVEPGDKKGKKKILVVKDPTPTGDPLLDEALRRVQEAKRRASVRTWVSRFARLKDLHHRLARTLCQQGILREKEDRVLGLFKRRIYPELNPKPERALKERLRRAIFEDGARVDPRLTILISLAHSTRVLEAVFPKKELKARRKRIEAIDNGDLVGKAAKEAIEAMHTAVIAAVAVTTVAAAASGR